MIIIKKRFLKLHLTTRLILKQPVTLFLIPNIYSDNVYGIKNKQYNYSYYWYAILLKKAVLMVIMFYKLLLKLIIKETFAYPFFPNI